MLVVHKLEMLKHFQGEKKGKLEKNVKKVNARFCNLKFLIILNLQKISFNITSGA